MIEQRSVLRTLASFALLAAAIGVATAWVGWWSVPVLAFGYGAIARDARRRGTLAALAAVVAWGDLLALGEMRGANIGAAATRVAGVMGVPALMLFIATLVFAALLAGPAAVLGGIIPSRRAPVRAGP